jgi:hypothetical protein
VTTRWTLGLCFPANGEGLSFPKGCDRGQLEPKNTIPRHSDILSPPPTRSRSVSTFAGRGHGNRECPHTDAKPQLVACVYSSFIYVFEFLQISGHDVQKVSAKVNFKLTGGKRRTVPVASRGGPHGCETSRLPHFLDIRLTDGTEVVSLTRRPPSIPGKIPGTHFC